MKFNFAIALFLSGTTAIKFIPQADEILDNSAIMDDLKIAE